MLRVENVCELIISAAQEEKVLKQGIFFTLFYKILLLRRAILLLL